MRRPAFSSRRDGVALVLVLAFVVLLAGLMVAFFSRAINDRDLSNSSADQMQITLFTQGALSQVVGDLKQEIVAGSATPAPLAPTGVKLYAPAGPLSAVVNPGGRIGGTAPPPLPPNALKRSAGAQAFFDSAGNPASYPGAGAFPPSQRAYGDPSAASLPVPITAPSANARLVTLERWNKPMLIPTVSDTSQVPVGGFNPPEWILVSRSTANPRKWDPAMVWTPNGTATVVGRYAYTVYNEGGLLDMNAAGYPVDGKGNPISTVSPADVGHKGLLAMADLTQLHSPGPGRTGMSAAEIGSGNGDGILGWRSAATVSAAGVASPYAALALNNPSGFLRVFNPVNSTGTDRMFVGRQHLLDFIRQKLPNSGAAHDALQYMGTFSRDLNQPSLIPVHAATDAFASSGVPPLPALLDRSAGGNDQVQASYKDLNPALPLLSMAKVYPSMTSADGTMIYTNKDVLVKQRFPLNRLAWLTYRGPSNLRATSTNAATDPDIVQLKKDGVSQDFLLLGTPANIQYYFGLKWEPGNYWSVPRLTPAGAIQTLAEVAANKYNNGAREPNFIELVKAAVTTGALGKAFTFANTLAADPADATDSQAYRDRAVDTQVLQIVANIIDQADVDGYPTRIRPTAAQEIRGVENLPYLYRVRNAAWRITDAAPVSAGGTPDPAKIDPSLGKQPGRTITNAGLAVLVQEPEIWNPHAAPTAASGLAYPPVKALGVRAQSGLPAPNYLGLPASSTSLVVRPWVYDPGKASPFAAGRENGPLPSPAAGTALILANTLLSCSPNPSSYREPTLLVKPKDGLSAANPLAVRGTPTVYGSAEPAPAGTFVGIVLGSAPIAWASDKNSVTDPKAAGNAAHLNVAQGLRVDLKGSVGEVTPASPPPPTASPAPVNLTYQVVCDDPNSTGASLVYDEKYFAVENYTTPIGQTLMNDQADANGGDYRGQMLGGNRFMTCFDPRTSRFGMQTSNLYDNTDAALLYDYPPNRPGSGSLQWVSQAANVTATDRPEKYAGYGALPSNAGTLPKAPLPVYAPPPSNTLGWTWDNALLRYGVFAVNSMNAPLPARERFAGDAGVPAGATTAAQYYADADGVVRRGSAAWSPGPNPVTGSPLATANLSPEQAASRPVVLNRPFRNVGELGYVFSDTPWKNLDFSTPESGYAGLLDMFCLASTDNNDALVAGRIDLNTRQAPVLQAVLAGAIRDENTADAQSPVLGGTDAGDAHAIAALLVQRTQPGGTTGSNTPAAPLANVRDLVGRWNPPPDLSLVPPIDGSAAYDGFSADLKNTTDKYANNLDRYRTAAIRALSGVGTTRTWNLMIDVIAQTGRYPTNATSADKFLVEGEQRGWLHIAIDRLTGRVIDQQYEVVKE